MAARLDVLGLNHILMRGDRVMLHEPIKLIGETDPLKGLLFCTAGESSTKVLNSSRKQT